MNFITKNFHLKFLAFFSAIILWLFVVGIENTVYLFPQDLEIQAQNMPANLNLASPLGSAKIRVSVGSDIVKNLNKSDFQITVDLKDLAPGEYTLPLIATSNNDKVTILKIEPPVVHLKLESVEEKEVKIKTSISGNPKKGYKVKDYKLTQQTAKISGTKDLLAKINNVNAEIKLDGSQSDDFTQNVELELPQEINQSGQNVTIIPAQVSAQISFIPEVEVSLPDNGTPNTTQENSNSSEQQKVVVVQPNIQGSVDLYSFYQKIEITPLTVTIKGSPEALKSVNLLQTEAIQLSWLRAQQKPVKVKLVIPPNVSLVDPTEKSVLINLKVTSNS